MRKKREELEQAGLEQAKKDLEPNSETAAVADAAVAASVAEAAAASVAASASASESVSAAASASVATFRLCPHL